MNIRPLSPEDLPVLLDLTIATFGPFYENSYRPAVGEVVFANRHGGWRQDYRIQLAGIHNPGAGRHTSVALVDGRLVGFVAWSCDPKAHHGQIDILAVDSRYRRLGIGRALAEQAIAAMNADGVKVVTIGTGGDDFHAPARALYESMGFIPFPNIIYSKAV
jgi:ribosomal protein S18 acetylase RimI-like enzyme